MSHFKASLKIAVYFYNRLLRRSLDPAEWQILMLIWKTHIIHETGRRNAFSA